jgi:hypothetical protein
VYFYSFAIISPCRMVIPFIWKKLETPSSPKDDLRQVWLKLAQWFWRKSRKCKSLQTDGQPAIRIAHLSFQLRWARNYRSNKNNEINFTKSHDVKESRTTLNGKPPISVKCRCSGKCLIVIGLDYCRICGKNLKESSINTASITYKTKVLNRN